MPRYLCGIFLLKKKTPIFPAIIYYLVIDIIKVEFDGKSLGFQRDPVLGS